MNSRIPDPAASGPGPGEAAPAAQPAQGSGNDAQAADGPARGPVPAADAAGLAAPADSTAEAEGRRILSTAFVRVGPDGRLAVELRDGRLIVLRDVVMRAKDYCGVQLAGGKAGGRYCGGYAEVAAARPGAEPAPDQPAPAVDLPSGPARED